MKLPGTAMCNAKAGDKPQYLFDGGGLYLNTYTNLGACSD
jgi:hypothetical protein